MTYEVLGPGGLNYAPCRYGNSRILFRGPQRRLDAPYVAFIGGTETYGKFIKTPFPALVESDLGVNCINFGIPSAGVDVFLNDNSLLEVANGAQAVVLQVVGAHNLSNRFYSVHPRRNDRFLSASPLLSAIYPEVDFSEFHFTRHMLNILFQISEARFAVVRDELQSAWSARMKLLLRRMRGRVVLVWFADHLPLADRQLPLNPSDCPEPLFVTRKMLDDLRAGVSRHVEVAASDSALAAGTKGMVFNELETTAAHKMMGPQAHGEVAIKIGQALLELVKPDEATIRAPK